MEKLPLEGIMIVDASRVLAGPFCSMILSDLGARIVKIEDPAQGDETRAYGPMIGGESSYFLSINRNKEVAFLDLKSRDGKEELYKLVAKADVFLHNFLPRVERELGVTYDLTRKVNPGIIYVTISGYGREGPRSDLPGYDIMMQAESGLMSVTGQDRENVARVGNSTVDIYAGYLAAVSILAHILEHRRNGKKKAVNLDISLIGSAIYSMPFLFGAFSATGKDPVPYGTAHPGIVPYQLFRTKDGSIMIAVANNNHWSRFCRSIGREDLLRESRFRTNEFRVKNRKLLVPQLEEAIAAKTTDQWLGVFRNSSVPASPVNRISDVLKERDFGDLILRKKVRGMKMLFTNFPALSDGKMVRSYRSDPPPFRSRRP